MNPNDGNIWLAPFAQLWGDISQYLPHLVAALVVLLGGFAVAWLLRQLAARVFNWFKMDEKLSGLWLSKLWTRGLGHQPSVAASNFCFYSVLCLSMILAVRLLGEAFGQTILAALLEMIPRVLSVILILLLGTLLAMFLSVLSQMALAGYEVQHPHFWGKVIAWGTFIVAAMFSLEQLGLAGRVLTVVVLILLGGISLAAALAFGLGCKDLAKEFLIELLRGEENGAREP